MTEVLTVLIVEDTEDDALLTVEILCRDGLEITWEQVETAADLGHMLSTRHWDAIISDHNLPGFDAATALAIVREQGLDVPFIVVSRTFDEQQAVALMKAGARDYVIKGNLARLPEIVRREVREAQNRCDRQRVEQALQLSEARFQKLVAAQPGTPYTVVQRANGDRTFTYLSSTGVNLFEIPTEIALADFSAIAALLHPEDRSGADAAIAHSAATLTPLHGEWRIITPSGKTKWVQVHGQPESLPNDDVQWLGVVLQVTDRKQAELTVTRQHDLNHLMMEVTQRFVEVRAAKFDTEVTRALAQIGAYIQADHGHVVVLADAEAPSGGTMRITHQWCRPDCPAVRQLPDTIPMAAFPWAAAALLRREVVNVPQVGALSADCVPDRASCQGFDVGAVLSVPLVQKTQVLGAVGFLTLGRPAAWDDNIQTMVQVLAQTIAAAQARLQSEHLLAKREAQSWAILSVMPDLLIRMGADGRYREVLSQNHPLDIVPPSQSRIGRHVSEVVPADLAELKLQAIRQALATHEVQTYEQQIQVGDRVQQEELRAVRFGDDEVLFLIRDISDRKQAERQLKELNQSLAQQVAERTATLQEREARYRGLMEGASDAILVADMEGHILEVNRRTEELFGRSRDQLTQMHQSQLHPPENKAELIALFEDSAELPHFQASNVPILHVDGRHIPVDITSTTIDLGTTRVLQGIFRDVSNRQRIEAENQRLQDRLGFLLGASPAVIYSIEPTGHYRPTFISQNLADILGYESEAFIANFTDWREYYHPDEADSCWGGISAVGERGCYAMEYRFRHRDGHYLWVQDEARMVYNTQGQPQEIIGYLADITARKQAEERLRQTNAELMRATCLKDEFLANMSHELRTPLNAILGMTEGLQVQAFGAINDRQIKALTIVETSATHLLALINDILDVAKIESGQITLQLTPTAIAPLCRSSLTFVQQQAYKKRIQLMDCIPPNLPNLAIDERRVRQILINLLANAVKFTPEGGRVSLTVTPELCQDGDKLQSMMRFTVKDTGIGIAPNDQQRLFQPFIQIDSALNRQYEGTGLGLTLVKQFTELHGGQVGLVSEVGVGSSFTIDLPCEVEAGRWTASPDTAVASVSEAPALPDQKPLILLVEDQEATVSTIVNYLTAKGYRLLVTRPGEAAIALALAENPDLIVMDMKLSEGDGLEAIRRIRADLHLASRPIIALSTLTSANERDRCLAAGANQHLSKPLKLKQLVAAIQHLLTPLAHPSLNSPADL